MNKYIRLISVSAILGLTSFIPLSHASDLQLASSFAIHSYAGDPSVGCCTPDAKHKAVPYKHHYKHHHKQPRKHYKKRHHKHHHKPKPSCGCQ